MKALGQLLKPLWIWLLLLLRFTPAIRACNLCPCPSPRTRPRGGPRRKSKHRTSRRRVLLRQTRRLGGLRNNKRNNHR